MLPISVFIIACRTLVPYLFEIQQLGISLFTVLFLTKHTAACSMIGYWHDTLGCLSVRLSVCDEVHCGKTIHATGNVSEQVNNKCPLGTQFYNVQSLTPTISPHALHILNSHLQHAVQLFQTMLNDRLFLSNSWASC